MGLHLSSSVLPWDHGRAVMWANPRFVRGGQCWCGSCSKTWFPHRLSSHLDLPLFQVGLPLVRSGMCECSHLSELGCSTEKLGPCWAQEHSRVMKGTGSESTRLGWKGCSSTIILHERGKHELISARMQQFNAQFPLLSLYAMYLTNQSSQKSCLGFV